METFFVQVTNFEEIMGKYGGLSARFNNENYRYAQYASGNENSNRKPTNARGVTIGGAGSSKYNGLIAEVIFFNERLSDEEIDLISNYLSKNITTLKHVHYLAILQDIMLTDASQEALKRTARFHAI